MELYFSFDVLSLKCWSFSFIQRGREGEEDDGAARLVGSIGSRSAECVCARLE
jgi:hypothetical protein